MRKSKKSNNPVLVERYMLAFCKCFQCANEDFLIKPLEEGGSMMAYFKGGGL